MTQTFTLEFESDEVNLWMRITAERINSYTTEKISYF